MESISKCLKEWNATVEALGQGKQTILIRNYRTNLTEYLLYPTVSYALKDDFLDSFHKKHRGFVEKHALPEKKGDKVLLKYYATLEKLIERPVSRIPPERNYIWTREHVKNYMSGKKAYIWVLRVHQLKEPYWADPTPGAIKYANLKEEVSLEGIEPVLSDREFEQIIKNI
jgi:restriction system protein